MNNGAKDLDTWGRKKARNRYESGGGVPVPMPRPDIEGAARKELAKKMRTEPMPDNTKSIRMPDQVDDNAVRARYYDMGRSGLKDLKRGGRAK